MSSNTYVDTSALAKWYVREEGSEEVEAWLQRTGPVSVSSLTVLELRSLLARRRRAREIAAEVEMAVFARVEEHVTRGFLWRHATTDNDLVSAVHVIAGLPSHPLRALDALHLAVARRIGAETVATADRLQAEAAEALGFAVVRFGAAAHAPTAPPLHGT